METMKILSGVLMLLLNISIALSFSDEYFDEQRLVPYEGSLPDEDIYDLRGSSLDETAGTPYNDVLQLLKKRSYPRWYHAFVYRNPTLRTSPLAQSKRFLPFHPLARFRGLAMGGAGGGLIGGGGGPYRHDNYETFVSDSSSVPSPGHPVPSGDTKEESADIDAGSLSDLSQGDRSISNHEGRFQEPPKEKINAGDILRYLSSTHSDRGLGSQSKVFRFGIK